MAVLKSGFGETLGPQSIRGRECARYPWMESLREASLFGPGCVPAHTCVPGCCTGGGSCFRLWLASCWSPALSRRYCRVPGRIQEHRPKETLSLVHGNKLSCVQVKGHCSEGADSLQLRITLEGGRETALDEASGFGPLLLWGKSGDWRPIGRPRLHALWGKAPWGPEQQAGQPRAGARGLSSRCDQSQPTGRHENGPQLCSHQLLWLWLTFPLLSDAFGA